MHIMVGFRSDNTVLVLSHDCYVQRAHAGELQAQISFKHEMPFDQAKAGAFHPSVFSGGTERPILIRRHEAVLIPIFLQSLGLSIRSFDNY